MSAAPSNPTPAGDDRKFVVVDDTNSVTFEDKLQLFWKKNGTAVLILCGLVLVGILGKGGYEYMQAQKEKDVEQEYAAATTPDALKTFASAHAGHPLAGVAQLSIADQAYAAGKWADAQTAYDVAASTLKTGPLATRAQFGRAMARLQAGKNAEATTDLQQIANDSTLTKEIRSEALYDLTSLAVDAKDNDGAKKYSEQALSVEPQGMWAKRAMMLRLTLPGATPPAPAPAATTPAAPVVTPAVTLPKK